MSIDANSVPSLSGRIAKRREMKACPYDVVRIYAFHCGIFKKTGISDIQMPPIW